MDGMFWVFLLVCFIFRVMLLLSFLLVFLEMLVSVKVVLWKIFLLIVVRFERKIWKLVFDSSKEFIVCRL